MAGVNPAKAPDTQFGKAQENASFPKEAACDFRHDNWIIDNRDPDPENPTTVDYAIQGKVILSLPLPRFLEQREIWCYATGGSADQVRMKSRLAFYLAGVEVLSLPFNLATELVPAAGVAAALAVSFGGGGVGGGHTLTFRTHEGSERIVPGFGFRLCCDRVDWIADYQLVLANTWPVGLLAVKSETLWPAVQAQPAINLGPAAP